MGYRVRALALAADRGLAWFLRTLVRLYQLTLSAWLGRQCRFYPTCSHYALEAIERHGGVRGLKLAVSRVARCQPFHPGGIDEVPGHHH